VVGRKQAPMGRYKATEIVFTRVEGEQSQLGTWRFTGERLWDEVEDLISKLRWTAPKTGGYDKCDVAITFAPDETGFQLVYRTRYDMQHYDESGYGDGLARQVCREWRFYAGRSRPARMTASQHSSFLANRKIDASTWQHRCDAYDVPGLAVRQW
jgi:hypothetical protein